MAAAGGYWTKVEEFLRGRPDEDATQLDLRRDVQLDAQSPLPSEIAKIDMAKPFDRSQYMENIVRNIFDQDLKLRVSTWHDIKFIYTMAGGQNPPIYRQKLMQVLLIASKLSAIEYYETRGKHEDPTGSVEYIFDEYFLIRIVLKHLGKMSIETSIKFVEDDISTSIKEFLCLPAIVNAFKQSLGKVGLEKDEQWIRNSINEMKISLTHALSDFNGFALVDGILLIASDVDWQWFISASHKYPEVKAKILTAAIHECAHFLARLAVGDFNFSSPGKGNERRFDSAIDGKNLELGRNSELILFGGIQPHWPSSSSDAALDFLRSARTAAIGPLVHEKVGYLKRRDFPSLSFAGDLDDPHDVVGC